jgi:hypothetical protein
MWSSSQPPVYAIIIDRHGSGCEKKTILTARIIRSGRGNAVNGAAEKEEISKRRRKWGGRQVQRLTDRVCPMLAETL